MKKTYALILAAMILLTFIPLASSCSTTVTLYFASEEGNNFYLVPETRNIEVSDDIYMETVRQLIKGPEGSSLYPTLPSGTTVRSVDITDGLATVDFDISIITDTEIPHSSTTETLAIYSIVDTLTEFDDIDSVRITVEGMQSGEVEGYYVEDFWGHIGIYEDFARNEEIIRR